MSRYSARIRALEVKLRLGKCRACGDGQRVSIEMLELEEGQPEPVLEPKLCEVCGKPSKRVVWLIYGPSDDEIPAITGVVRGEVTAPLVPQSMTSEVARAILRAAEEDGMLPD